MRQKSLGKGAGERVRCLPPLGDIGACYPADRIIALPQWGLYAIVRKRPGKARSPGQTGQNMGSAWGGPCVLSEKPSYSFIRSHLRPVVALATRRLFFRCTSPASPKKERQGGGLALALNRAGKGQAAYERFNARMRARGLLPFSEM